MIQVIHAPRFSKSRTVILKISVRDFLSQKARAKELRTVLIAKQLQQHYFSWPLDHSV